MPEQDQNQRRGKPERCLGALIAWAAIGLFWMALGGFLLMYVCMGMTWQGIDVVRHEIRKRKSL